MFILWEREINQPRRLMENKIEETTWTELNEPG